jgi:hypothetical protein
MDPPHSGMLVPAQWGDTRGAHNVARTSAIHARALAVK